jgi:hypothetical protein
MVASHSMRLTATVAAIAAVMTLVAAPARGADAAARVGAEPASALGRLGAFAPQLWQMDPGQTGSWQIGAVLPMPVRDCEGEA